jgi:hypothetical protein
VLLQAMASAFYGAVIEGVLSVADPGFHDNFMMRSFDIMLTCTVIFAGLSTFCGFFYQWRCLGDKHQPNMFKISWDSIKW